MYSTTLHYTVYIRWEQISDVRWYLLQTNKYHDSFHHYKQLKSSHLEQYLSQLWLLSQHRTTQQHLDQQPGWSRRISSSDICCYVICSPACRCHANCLIIISDTFITGGRGDPLSCPFITLVRFVWKISGFRYFPIHCHWYDRDKFGLSLTIFIAWCSPLAGLVKIFQVFYTDWS